MNLEKSEIMKIEMFNLKTLPTQHIAPIKDYFYLPTESSTPEKKLICTKGTASSVAHSWTPQERATLEYNSVYSSHHELHHQVGIPAGVGFGRKLLDSYCGISHIMPEVATVSQLYGLTASTNPPRPITSDESEEIVIVPLRELPREDAKIEISKYVQLAGGRKVYISELAEELRLDIELIIEIMEELEDETRE